MAVEVAHVAQGVNADERPQDADDQRHQHGELVGVESALGGQAVGAGQVEIKGQGGLDQHQRYGQGPFIFNAVEQHHAGQGQAGREEEGFQARQFTVEIIGPGPARGREGYRAGAGGQRAGAHQQAAQAHPGRCQQRQGK